MASAAILSEIRRWNSTASPNGIWEKMAEVTAINHSGLDVDMLETTSLDNTDRYKTFIAGMIDGGEISLSMNFTRDEYETAKNDAESTSNQNYEIVLSDPDNTSFEFEGHITNIPFALEAPGLITSDVTIKVTGKPNLESGSGPSAGA